MVPAVDDTHVSESGDVDHLLRRLAAAPSPSNSAASLLAEGTVLDGRLVIEERIGSGGMGIVLLAQHLKLERRVAVKVTQAGEEQIGTSRLIREARAMARIFHENVVTVYDVGTVGGHVYIAMEYLDGGTARTWVTERDRPWSETLALYIKAGRGLAAAHAADMVHRDFKPDNVLLGLDGRVRVADFGLVRASTSGSGDLSVTVSEPARALEVSLTRTGAAVGTPAYMAPEQYANRGADEVSDQFAFCVSLWEALHGQRPFLGLSSAEIQDAMRKGPPTPPSGSVVPKRITRILMRGLAADPRQRFHSMRHLLAELSHDPAKRRRRYVGGIALVAATAAATWAAAQASTEDRCAGVQERLDGIWDASRADAMATAFGGTGDRHAPAAYERTAEALDAYAARWVSESRSACEARSGTALDLRVACLDRRRAELGALVDLLVGADPSLVLAATTAAAKLSPLDACRDSEALARAETIHAEDRGAVAEVDAALLRVKELVDSGRYADALERLEALAPRLEQLGYNRPLAEASLWWSKALSRSGDHDDASSRSRRALSYAVAAGADRLASVATRDLIYIDGYLRSDAEQGREWARQARGWVQRANHDPLLEARRLGALSLAEREAGQLDTAIALATNALELLEGVEGAGLETMLITSYLAEHQNRAGRSEAALRTQQRALPLAAAHYGPAHPEYGRYLINAAAPLFALGRTNEARERTREAIAIRRAALGAPDIISARAQVNLGVMLVADRRFEEGDSLMLEGIAAAEELGSDARDLIMMKNNRVRALTQLGRIDEVAELLDDLLARASTVYPPGHPATRRLYLNRASTASRRDDHQRELEFARKGLEGVSEQLDPTLRGLLRAEVASALASLDRCREALPFADRSLADLRRVDRSDYPYLFYPLVTKAECLATVGRAREAAPFVEEAATQPKLSEAEHKTLADLREHVSSHLPG